ncbi:hypothetical protein AOQ72_04345 [Bradyrhizobium yuanmingense]|uniref:Uncharacterized protein n=1 Tax=Bradyrhizobium yuanmingense TaxID=108015 RepID=A0A0R3BL19_9BRAD|nr:hypothetical protein [Bradyrhizobium yuanmingense]KRP85874.1 hypothetical protein AOQ72_04345 [Bradyrhizobium yuanmingense]
MSPRKTARARHLEDALEVLIVGKHINSFVGHFLAAKEVIAEPAPENRHDGHARRAMKNELRVAGAENMHCQHRFALCKMETLKVKNSPAAISI